jgi:hypothetical protein
MTIPTPKQVANWKRIAEAASDGPWEWSGDSAYVTCQNPDYEDKRGPLARIESCRREDNEFIAAAREAVPALIAAAEELHRLDAHYRASERLRQSYMRDQVKMGTLLNIYRGLARDIHSDPEECPNFYDGCHCLAISVVEMLKFLRRWRAIKPLGGGLAGYGRLCIETDEILKAAAAVDLGEEP